MLDPPFWKHKSPGQVTHQRKKQNKKHNRTGTYKVTPSHWPPPQLNISHYTEAI